jgi:RNA polymerase sigma factor (sigma-70 family)
MPSVAQDWELRDVLVSLKPADRELLAYRYVLGFRSDEIGQHLGLSAAGIRSRLKRIRDRLKKELAKNE